MAVRSVNIGRPRARNAANGPLFDRNGPSLPGIPGAPIGDPRLLAARFQANRIILNFSVTQIGGADITFNVPADMGMAFRNGDSSKWIGFSVNTANASATVDDVNDPYDWQQIGNPLLALLTAFRDNVANEDFFFDYDTEGLIPNPNAGASGKPFRFGGRDISQVNFMGKALTAGHIRGHRFYES